MLPKNLNAQPNNFNTQPTKGSSPYMICTPAIGNSNDGRYYVKFGDTTKAGDRLDGYNTYLPKGNRTSSQLPQSTEYRIVGNMLELQIFQASNPRLERQAFNSPDGTEWYEVWPKDEHDKPDPQPLRDVLNQFNSATNVARAKTDITEQFPIQQLIFWLHGQIPSSWARQHQH